MSRSSGITLRLRRSTFLMCPSSTPSSGITAPWELTGPGEVYGANYQHKKGPTPPTAHGQHFVGTPDMFLRGVEYSPLLPIIERDPFGLISACSGFISGTLGGGIGGGDLVELTGHPGGGIGGGDLVELTGHPGGGIGGGYVVDTVGYPGGAVAGGGLAELIFPIGGGVGGSYLIATTGHPGGGVGGARLVELTGHPGGGVATARILQKRDEGPGAVAGGGLAELIFPIGGGVAGALLVDPVGPPGPSGGVGNGDSRSVEEVRGRSRLQGTVVEVPLLVGGGVGNGDSRSVEEVRGGLRLRGILEDVPSAIGGAVAGGGLAELIFPIGGGVGGAFLIETTGHPGGVFATGTTVDEGPTIPDYPYPLPPRIYLQLTNEEDCESAAGTYPMDYFTPLGHWIFAGEIDGESVQFDFFPVFGGDDEWVLGFSDGVNPNQELEVPFPGPYPLDLDMGVMDGTNTICDGAFRCRVFQP